MINDVSALRADPELAPVVRAHDAILVLMHAKDGPLPHVTERPARFTDLIVEVSDFLLRRAEVALDAGIAQTRIVLDPGMSGFLSLEPGDSWRLLEGFARLVERLRPFPVLIACSRKGFLGVPPAERDPVSQLTALLAVSRGAMLVRTHDVRMMRQFIETGRRMGLALPGGRDAGQEAG
jgi:dihydropteroate synthase